VVQGCRRIRVAASNQNKDVQVRREATWQAAELYEKAGNDQRALGAYERYVRQFARPLEPAIEARDRLVGSA